MCLTINNKSINRPVNLEGLVDMNVVDTKDTIEAIWVAKLNGLTNPVNSTNPINPINLGLKAMADTMANTISVK